jgi:hypothetical protein
MTAKQQSYMNHLANEAGISGRYAWAHAASRILGDRSPSKIERKGLTVGEASKVIDELKSGALA